MRTPEEVRAQIVPYTVEHQTPSESFFTVGLSDALETAAMMIERGATPAELLILAQGSERNYTSYGNDDEDMYQNGRLCALYWAAEQYDWDAEGNPIYRAGNIWNLPVTT